MCLRNNYRFLPSEQDLDLAIKSLSGMSIVPENYGVFVSLGGMATLTGLLQHENVDIAIGVLGVLGELVDEGMFFFAYFDGLLIERCRIEFRGRSGGNEVVG